MSLFFAFIFVLCLIPLMKDVGILLVYYNVSMVAVGIVMFLSLVLIANTFL